jgi:hypothetical protein
MSNERERDEEKQVRNTSLTPETGSVVAAGEGLAVRVKGPGRDGIRTSDSRGWTAAADITDGRLELASASGIKSEGEHLTLDTTEIVVRRKNLDGSTWGKPKQLPQNDGDDCEAPDSRGRRYPPLRVRVSRPKMPPGFWKGITLGSNVPPGPAQEAARALWDAVERERPAKPVKAVLAINAIRTPWLALPPIVETFRQQYGQEARRLGFQEVWVVGWSEAFTERLDTT